MIENITEEFLNLIKLPSLNGRRLNYLFVMPPIVKRPNIMYPFPIGLCLVCSALKASGRNVMTLNMNFYNNQFQALKDSIVNNDIDVVLVGGLTAQFQILYDLLRTVKSIKRDIITLVGGGIISSEPEAAMEALEYADYGMIGEGEITVNELAYTLETCGDLSNVSGIVYKSYDRYTITSKREDILNLDIIPFPDYEGFGLSQVLSLSQNTVFSVQHIEDTRAVSVAIGRSCPYNCTFCFHPSGSKYRRRSFENIVKEIDWLQANYDLDTVFFIDEMFIYSQQFVASLAYELKRRGLRYIVSAHVNAMTPELVKVLADTGCMSITYGIESGDNYILKSMGKHTTVEKITEVLNWSKEAGLPVKGNVILGDINETPESIENSANWWKTVCFDHDIRMGLIMTYPGTELYRSALRRGIIEDKIDFIKSGDAIINVTGMDYELYHEMINKAFLFVILIKQGMVIEFSDIDNIINIFRANMLKLTNCMVVSILPISYDTVSLFDYIDPRITSGKNVVYINQNAESVMSAASVNPRGKQISAASRRRIHTFDEFIKLYNKSDYIVWAYPGSASDVDIKYYSKYGKFLHIKDLCDPDFKF